MARLQKLPARNDRRRLSQCTINPELRDGIATRTPVVPGERYDMAPPCFAIAHLRAGHRLVLRVTKSDPDEVPLFAIDPQITGVHGRRRHAGGPAGRARGEDNVPLDGGSGPAQPSLSATVAPTLGLPARAPGTTTAFYVLESLAQYDNASATVTAVPSAPADIDLFLQRQRPDKTWSGDLFTAGSSSLSSETMTTGRLAPGTYRVEVHNWAGLPGTSVNLSVDFKNSLRPVAGRVTRIGAPAGRGASAPPAT